MKEALSLEAIREKYRSDQFSTKAAGIEILEAAPGYAKCAMPVRPIHFNAMGNIMGGAIFTLADFTYAVALNAMEEEVVSVESSISYLELSRGPVLYGTSTCLRNGRRTNSYRIDITDDAGVLVAVVNIRGMIL